MYVCMCVCRYVGMYVCMEWNGMEWNGTEWNGMEWNVLAAKHLHTGSSAALADFSLHESITEHIQVPKVS